MNTQRPRATRLSELLKEQPRTDNAAFLSDIDALRSVFDKAPDLVDEYLEDEMELGGGAVGIDLASPKTHDRDRRAANIELQVSLADDLLSGRNPAPQTGGADYSIRSINLFDRQSEELRFSNPEPEAMPQRSDKVDSAPTRRKIPAVAMLAIGIVAVGAIGYFAFAEFGTDGSVQAGERNPADTASVASVSTEAPTATPLEAVADPGALVDASGVTLRGEVPDIDTKDAYLSAATSMVGSANVIDEMTVVEGYQQTDELVFEVTNPELAFDNQVSVADSTGAIRRLADFVNADETASMEVRVVVASGTDMTEDQARAQDMSNSAYIFFLTQTEIEPSKLELAEPASAEESPDSDLLEIRITGFLD